MSLNVVFRQHKLTLGEADSYVERQQTIQRLCELSPELAALRGGNKILEFQVYSTKVIHFPVGEPVPWRVFALQDQCWKERLVEPISAITSGEWRLNVTGKSLA